MSLIHRLTGLSSLLLLLNVFSFFFGLTYNGLLFHFFLDFTSTLLIDISGYHFVLTWYLALPSMHLLCLSFD